MEAIEYPPSCGDYTDDELWHQEQMNELEQMVFQTESNLNDLFDVSPDLALSVVTAFLKAIPERVAENPKQFIMH